MIINKIMTFINIRQVRDQNINKIHLDEVNSLVKDLFGLLYPESRHICLANSYKKFRYARMVRKKFKRVLLWVVPKKDVDKLFKKFVCSLPRVVSSLDEDASFLASEDPAAKRLFEVLLCYPGFFALSVYRMAHELEKLSVPIIPRLFTEYAHSRTGIDIHPGANIGVPFFIDHGTGVVIGETTQIGKRVKIYQGVTLGAKSVTPEQKGIKRHPTIEDDVVIYANATILGGLTVIGSKSIIGGNSWITKSVKENSTIDSGRNK